MADIVAKVGEEQPPSKNAQQSNRLDGRSMTWPTAARNAARRSSGQCRVCGDPHARNEIYGTRIADGSFRLDIGCPDDLPQFFGFSSYEFP